MKSIALAAWLRRSLMYGECNLQYGEPLLPNPEYHPGKADRIRKRFLRDLVTM